MATLTGAAGGSKCGFEVVQVAGFGRRIEFGDFCLQLVRSLFELGRILPNLGLGTGLAFVGTFGECCPVQFGHHLHHSSVVGRSLGIKWHTPLGHGTDAAKVLPHDEKAAFSVPDGIFRLGKLRHRGHSNA